MKAALIQYAVTGICSGSKENVCLYMNLYIYIKDACGGKGFLMYFVSKQLKPNSTFFFPSDF